MRKRIFEIIEVADSKETFSHIYDIIMMITIALSMIPLAFKTESAAFVWIDRITVSIFIIDYLLRFMTADIKLNRGWVSFLIYPITPMAIIDLVSILPSITIINDALRVLKIVRMVRTLRVLRIFKSFRYSKNIAMIGRVFQKQKKSLLTVGVLAVGYMLVSALVVFNVEPDTFASFFDALYWAAVSLTTVGYGDIYATTTAGKAITMISAVLGVAIVALPAGIITAGYMSEIDEDEKANDKTDDEEIPEEEKIGEELNV